jgi:DNA-binding PadR family transcriptional regulator
MSARQPDLFLAEPSPELFEDRPERKYYADPDKVRAELHKLLAEMRAAQSMPWDARTLTRHRTVFPQMTNWLPDDEAAQLRLELETALERLEAA